jgi:hypothetical protein
VLTSPRVAEILVGPAGSGKTRTLVHAAWCWQRRGGHVIGLATSQGARNVLARAGVPLAENTSVFLGHLPGERVALGIDDLPAGTLILIDEASMTSTADLADIISYAARYGHKVVVGGDHAQLAAVESGGGMRLLASQLATSSSPRPSGSARNGNKKPASATAQATLPHWRTTTGTAGSAATRQPGPWPTPAACTSATTCKATTSN